MIRHVVIFQFDKEKATEADLLEISANLEALVDIVPELVSIEVGINMNPAEKQDLTLIAEVANLDDLATYNVHPAHKAVGAKIRAILVERTCVDYLV